MKKIIFFFATLFVIATASGQVQNPVHWVFSAKKMSSGNYEIHLTATIDKGWHVYSQTTPKDGPVPTSFKFTKNPLLSFEGVVKETGKMQQHNEPLFGVVVKQFSDKVDFVQTVKVKGNIKTSVTGSVEFMVCNDKQCLPPKTEQFSISLQ